MSKRTHIPKQVKVSDKIYKVIKKKKVYDDNKETCWASSDEEEALIEIQHPQPYTKNSLLHEVIHLIGFKYALNFREKQVEILTTALRAFFIDNPKCINWLKNGT